MQQKPRKTISKEQTLPRSAWLHHPWFLLTLLTITIILCYYPLTRYFFSQDDFSLLFNSTSRSSSYMLNFFEPSPGLFRPLSKSLYFKAAYGLFDLNPTPYHAVSILFHILNMFLFYRLMMRFRLPPPTALVSTALFALSGAFLNVIAWIACIQQLLGQFFMLLSLLFGIKSLEKSSPKLTTISTIAYLLALLSMEQTYPVPILLCLYAYMEAPPSTQWKKLKESFRSVAPHIIILSCYVLFMLFWKQFPQEGPYAFHFGTNIVANLFAYLDRIFSFSVIFPFVSNTADSGLTVSHLFILALILYNLARRRERHVVFALAFFLASILPTLFLRDHIFYIHLYIPAFGMFYLLALAINDFFDILNAWNPKAAKFILLLFVIVLSFMSYTKVRANESRFIRPDVPLHNNFVFRRAIIAENVHEDIVKKTAWKPEKGILYMVSLGKVTSWYGTNVVTALGDGAALKLFFEDPDLEIFFMSRGDTIPGVMPKNSLVLFFDDYGHCYTIEEVEKTQGAPITSTIENPLVK